MKLVKTIALGAAALAFAGIASAQTYLRVAGSSAFRAPTQQAILDVMDVGSTAVAYDGSSYSGCSASIVSGTISGAPVIVKTYWTGSAAGLVDLVEGNSLVKWIPDTSIPAVGSSVAVTGAYTAEAGVTNVAMSDATASAISSSIATALTPGKAYAADVAAASIANGGVTAGPVGAVGVVTFEWVMGKQTGFAAPFTNVTQQQGEALIKLGTRPVSFFTGSGADSGDFVFFLGRNEDSGTRITAFAESQAGFGQACAQWQLAIDGTFGSTTAGTAISGMKLWPGNTAVNTIPVLKWANPGHSGYNTGGNVKAVLGTNNPVTGLSPSTAVSGFTVGTSKSYFVTCVGTADGAAIATAGGTELKYNGVAFNQANVQSGAYTLWGYEHLFYLTAATANTTLTAQAVIGGTPAQAVADAIADKIYTVDASSGGAGFLLSGMAVTRAESGLVVK